MHEDPNFSEAGPEKRGGFSLRQEYPLLVTLSVLLLTVFALLAVSLHRTQGHLIYALDDAYIHMAMAKNLVKHGVWGITPDGFTSSSSSPLWTLLLASTYGLMGVNSASPLILGLVSACLVLWVAYRVLRSSGTSPGVTFFALLAVIFFTPLPVLVLSGMEHALQTALTLMAAFLSARILRSPDARGERGLYLTLVGLAPLITMVRFEGMFLVSVIFVAFFLRRRVWRGLGIAVSGFLPIVSYGVISKLHGWPWFPTSVLLKTGFIHAAYPNSLLGDLADQGLLNLWEGKHVVALILFAVLLEIAGRRKDSSAWSAERGMTGIFVGTGILHLGFARVGWFYRYEAYLVALGIVLVACKFKEVSAVLGRPAASDINARESPFEGAAAFILVISLVFCLIRGATALKETPQATVNTFEQQFQMATFLQRYYQHSAVAVNDVGAVNFFAEIHCLDLWGLATPEVARLRMRGDYGVEEIAKLAMNSGARVAIVHDLYFREIGGLPREWKRVGQWQIHNKVVGGSDTVSIYAPDPIETELLVARLAEFSPKLPSGVAQSGLYLQSLDSHR